MIKKLFLLNLLMLSLIIAAEYTYEFTFDNPAFTQKNAHMIIELDKCMNQGIDGEPLLPYHAVTILLPPGESFESAELNILAKKSYPLMLPLMPKQADRPLSLGESGQFMMKESVYNKNEYSARKIKLAVQYYGGAAVLNGAIIPADYFPALNKVDLNSRVELKIKTKENGNHPSLNLATLEMLETLVDNPECVQRYVPKTSDDKERMLIVSTSSFETVFDTLIDHYAKYGIETEFLTMNTIATNYSGIDLPEKIRNAIKDRYTNQGLEYVLLGGDTWFVPTRGLSCQVLSGGELVSSDNIASDLYYAALDGNWDNNGNGIFGEYIDTLGYDEADLYPELAIGRFPAATLDQMQNMINKSIRYQVSPIVDEMDKHVFFGEFLYRDPYSIAAHYLELLIGSRNDNGYSTQGLTSNLNIKKWYDYDEYVDLWNQQTVISELDSGYSFLHHDGHANTSYMMKFFINEINDSDFVRVNGIEHTTPIFYSHGCNCGGFDYSNCIASKIVTSPYISVGGVFNSRYGWFNEGQTEGPSIHLHREFENAIYGLHYTQFARALSLARSATASWVTALGQHEQNALRWNFYPINVLGDPAMRIYSQKPVAPEVSYDLSLLHLGKVTASITKNSSAMENAGLAITDTSGQLLGFAWSNSSGEASVELAQAPIDGEVLNFFVSGENLLLSDTTIISTESSIEPVANYVLLNAYPNPFNPDITIAYNIPEQGDVSIDLFDMNGRFVENLVNREHQAGAYDINYHAEDLSSGLYVCRILVEGFDQAITRKILLLK